jgi:hypothetical protein
VVSLGLPLDLPTEEDFELRRSFVACPFELEHWRG